MDGHIFIDDEITPDYHKIIKQKLLANAAAPRITLHIASPGGSVYGGWKTYHALKEAGKPIDVIIDGEAQSMATFIALVGDTISARNPSVYMIHMPSMGIEGTADDLSSGANELKNIGMEMAQAYSNKTKIPIATMLEMMRKTTSLTAMQAKEYGFVDRVIEPLRAVAIGKKLNNMTKPDETIFAKLGRTIAKAMAELKGEPMMIDLPTQDGSMIITVDAPNEDSLIGQMATVNGAPCPDGDYVIQSGDTVTVKGGAVTEVLEAPGAAMPPTPPPPATPPTTPAKTLEQRMADMETALATMTSENTALKAAAAEAAAKIVTAEAEAAAAKTDKEKSIVMLADIQGQFTELKKKTVGDDKAPGKGKHDEPKAKGSGQEDEMLSELFESPELQWMKPYIKQN